MLIAGVCFEVAAAQTYQRGQNVAPAFEGWERNEDGSFSFLFGYMNRNWSEQIDVPVGEDNSFSPGDADRGQPTHFLPRRNRFVFKVRVPADWGDRELVWTLTSNGVTERAYATLRPDYIVDNTVIMSETGALGAGSSNASMRANQPPTITLEGPPVRETLVGGGDGRETSAEGAQSALTFDPPQVKVWEDTRTGANSPWSPLWVPPELPEDGRWTVGVTFDGPGTYLLRGRADDGGLFADVEVTVVVRAATS